jgi:hypothetical protein
MSLGVSAAFFAEAVNVTTKKNTNTTSSAVFTNKPPLLASNSLPYRVL